MDDDVGSRRRVGAVIQGHGQRRKSRVALRGIVEARDGSARPVGRIDEEEFPTDTHVGGLGEHP